MKTLFYLLCCAVEMTGKVMPTVHVVVVVVVVYVVVYYRMLLLLRASIYTIVLLFAMITTAFTVSHRVV